MKIFWFVFLFGITAVIGRKSRSRYNQTSSISSNEYTTTTSAPSSSKPVVPSASSSKPTTSASSINLQVSSSSVLMSDSMISSSISISCASVQAEFNILKQKVYKAIEMRKNNLIEINPIFAEWSVPAVKQLAEQFKLYTSFVANITSSFTNVSTDTILEIINGDSCEVPEPIKCIYDDLMELVDDIETNKDEREMAANEFEPIVRDFSNWTCPEIQDWFKTTFEPSIQNIQGKRVQLHQAQLVLFIRYSDFYANFFNELFRIFNYKKVYSEALNEPFKEVLKIYCNEPTDSRVLTCLRDLILGQSESFNQVIVDLQDLIEESNGICKA